MVLVSASTRAAMASEYSRPARPCGQGRDYGRVPTLGANPFPKSVSPVPSAFMR